MSDRLLCRLVGRGIINNILSLNENFDRPNAPILHQLADNLNEFG
ncbi:hypothetical protein [Calothrix rhizosoleniae]|nr:hypothetical protein [Calothrix rhizosoleniae]